MNALQTVQFIDRLKTWNAEDKSTREAVNYYVYYDLRLKLNRYYISL